MLTSTPFPVVGLMMERLPRLHDHLAHLVDQFPCPPPWNEDLLFRLNWTSCMGAEMGARVKYMMADKCKIRHSGGQVLPGPGTDRPDEVLEDDCGLPCQIVVSAVSVLVIVLMSLIVVICVRRHRAKSASPSHQSALTAHPDGAKYYTSCHYACAPVMPRQLQTSLQGNRAETALVPSTGPSSPANSCQYYPGPYPQPDCHPLAYHQHRQHLLRHHQGPNHAPHLINTPYGPVPAHTSSLIVPRIYAPPCAYRKLDGVNYSGSSCASDRSPVYETIDDDTSSRPDSIPSRARDTSQSECEFCKCGDDQCSENGGSAGYASYDAPVFIKGDSIFKNGDSVFIKGDPTQTPYKLVDTGDYSLDKFPHIIPYHHDPTHSNLVYPHRANEDPPGPAPVSSEGFYADEKLSQTLPLRPMKKGGHSVHSGGLGQNGGEEILPLKMSSSTQSECGDGSMRKRPSSGGSTNGGIYREANYNGQRRVVPALHPNYFSSSQGEIS